MEKWPIFDQNHGLTTFEKMSIFLDFGTSCFYSLERCFFVLDYRKTRHYGRYNVIYGKR